MITLINRYTLDILKDRMGKGVHGQIYLTNDIETNEKVVIKFINANETTNQECQINGNGTCLVMPFYRRSTLHQALTFQPMPITAEQRQNWIIQILSAVQYLHSTRISHEDLLTPNIFIDDNYQIKLGDFGMSKIYLKEVDATKDRKALAKIIQMLVHSEFICNTVRCQQPIHPEMLKFDMAQQQLNNGAGIDEVLQFLIY